MPRVYDTIEVRSSKPTQLFLHDLALQMRKVYERLASVINGKISLGDGTSKDNLDGAWASPVTPGAPNTDFAVTHNLGRIPVGYVVVKKSAACDVYDGSVAATATQSTLRATVAGVTLKIFFV